MNNMRPIPPGEHLREEMAELALSARALAAALGVPANRVTGVLNGVRAITADTALRLARYFGTTPEFWLNLQQAYDLRRIRRTLGKRIERKVRQRAA
ncbi:MAG: HigA family addiction module antitoxin [Pseudomonadota bacterium]